MEKGFKLDTQCVLEYPKTKSNNPHILPIYATSSFELTDFDHGQHVFSGKEPGLVYSRYGNPTIDVTSQKIADLEGFGLTQPLYGFMTSSGMSAISTLLTALLASGDEIVTQPDLYGGTTELFNSMQKSHGYKTHYVNLQDLNQTEDFLKRNTNVKLIFLETPSNPIGNCLDIRQLAEIAHRFSIKVIVDNTFCTPLLQQPIVLGADFVIHSTTKYLNGHGNSIAGVIVGKDPSLKSVIWKTLKLNGATCNAFDAWLVHNGMKTLALRMEKHSTNALAIAKYLTNNHKVTKVNYAGLESHKDHQLAKTQMKAFGGMLSFELKGGQNAVRTCMDAFQLITYAPTLGDVNTLVLHPRSSSHLNVDPTVSDKAGITLGLVRLSVGIENAEDLINDLDQALSKI